MKRRTPVAAAALARVAEPSRRMRSFSRHDRRSSIRNNDEGMCVARLMTTSWPWTADRTDAGSNRSIETGVAPTARSSSACSWVRLTAVTG